MKYWSIYKHVAPNGKVYVGISSNVKNRWAANGYYYHLSDTIFSRALNKYGWDSFQHIILQNGLTKQEACNKEKELIAYYKAKKLSLNTTDGGEGYCGKQSDEQIKHRVESRLVNSNTDYLVIDSNFNYIICQTEKEAAEYLGGTQRNISHVLRQPIGYTFKKHYLWKHVKDSNVDIESIKAKILKALELRRKRLSEASRKKSVQLATDNLRKTIQSMTSEERKAKYGHGEKRLGKCHSEETKRKMSEAAKGRDMSKAIKASSEKCRKPVVQLLNGLPINTFNSINEAAKYMGTSASNIAKCAMGERRTAKGFNWEFKEKEVIYEY